VNWFGGYEGHVSTARYAARSVARSEQIGWLGRLGLVAMGVSYGLVAALAIMLALGKGGETEDRGGALQTTAQNGFGRLVVFLLAIGFGAYAIWRFAEAFLDRGGEGRKPKGVAKRVGYFGRGLIYTGLCVIAVSVLLGSSGESNEKEETARVFDWPAGRWLVAAVGVGFAIASLWNVFRGLTRRFKKDLYMGEMSVLEEKLVTVVGTVGVFARGVVFALIGTFLIKAALEYDPEEAIGLDGALRKFAAQDHGRYLLGLVAAGLLSFGVFCLFQARYRQV
jgi:formate hydrogenlyase subunit 3/multisubunit Na+/H+ antiporter MnhD subunit